MDGLRDRNTRILPDGSITTSLRYPGWANAKSHIVHVLKWLPVVHVKQTNCQMWLITEKVTLLCFRV